MTKTSPGRRAGASICSTQALNTLPVIGPSRTRGATIPLALSPASKSLHGAAMAANLPRRHAAGLAHPLHQLDGRRRANLELRGRRTGRATDIDRPNDALAQILGQGCCHAGPLHAALAP